MAKPKRGRKKATKKKSSVKLKDDIRRVILDKICSDLSKKCKDNGGRKPYGAVAKLVNDMKKDCPWINRDIVNYSFKVYEMKMKAGPVEDSGSTGDDPSVTDGVSEIKKVGRPTGSTDKKNMMKKLDFDLLWMTWLLNLIQSGKMPTRKTCMLQKEP